MSVRVRARPWRDAAHCTAAIRSSQTEASVILRFHAAVRAALTDTLLRLYALEPAAIPSIVLEAPPTRAMGDLACPVAFELARRLRKAPRAIAAEIVAALGPIPGVSQAVAAPNGYVNVFLDRAAAIRLALGVTDEGAPAPDRCCRPKRRSSSTRRSTRTRPPTSATCATPRWATRWSACCATAASRSRCRTTSTTPASRSPTSSSASSISSTSRSRRCARSPIRRASTTTAGISTPASPSGTSRSRAPVGPQRDAARHRARRQRHRGARRLHRRSHRPDAPRDDGAAERRLRPPDVGGRHPAPEVLGPRLRPAARERHDVPADRGQARRLLGDADRRGGRRHAGRRSRAEAARGGGGGRRGRGRSPRAARESDRPIGRHRHLRRQGHRLPVLEVRAAGKDFQYRPFGTRLAGDTLWATTSTPGGDPPDRPAFGRALPSTT